jgi:ribosomal protein S10
MPTLHRFVDRDGYFVRGVSNGSPVCFGLTAEGEQYLLDTLGLNDGAKFGGDTLKWLYKQKWATNIENQPLTSGRMPAQSVPASAGAVATPGFTPATTSSTATVAQPPSIPAPKLSPVTTPTAKAAPARVDLNPIVYQGVMEIRLQAADQALLDQSLDDLVRSLRHTDAVILGPIPQPVRIEPYVVLREGTKKVFEVRQYARTVQVRQPRKMTVDMMNQLKLPEEIDINMRMLGPNH